MIQFAIQGTGSYPWQSLQKLNTWRVFQIVSFGILDQGYCECSHFRQNVEIGEKVEYSRSRKVLCSLLCQNSRIFLSKLEKTLHTNSDASEVENEVVNEPRQNDKGPNGSAQLGG